MGEFARTVSRDEIVDAITSFYNFLTTFPHLPPSAIQTPPPSGWPESDREVFRKLGKTDLVIDLLSHLPYIIDDREWHVGYDTQPICYNGDEVKRRIDDGDFAMDRAGLQPWHEEIPDHVISLTYGGNYGSWLLLDMQEGTIINYSVLGAPQPKCSQAEFDNGTAWRYYPAMRVKEFFESWKEKYRSLEWIPMPAKDGTGGTIWVPGAKKEEDLQEIRKIYHDHGWPSADFRKDECKTALQEWFENWEKKLLENYRKEMKER